MLLLLSVAFVISRRASVEEAIAEALKFLTYSAFLITIPILVFYVIARAFLRAHTGGGES